MTSYGHFTIMLLPFAVVHVRTDVFHCFSLLSPVFVKKSLGAEVPLQP